MVEEAKERSEELSIEFKNTLFAHSVASQNPDLFFSLYPDTGLTPEQEDQIEWEKPESLFDAQRMIAELQSSGWQED